MSLEKFAKEYGEITRFVTAEMPESEKKLIQAQMAAFMENKAGKYLKYQLYTAYLRMAQRASAVQEEKRDYYSGRMDQAGADIGLLSKVVSTLTPPKPRS